MLQSVGNYKIGTSQHGIIACNLIEDIAGNFDLRPFIFDYAHGSKVAGKNDSVAPSSSIVKPNSLFVSHKSGRETEMRGQIIHKMLSDPFFRGGGDIFLP